MMSFVSECCNVTPDSFLKSVDILVNKPHVVNKRIWGNKIWYRYTCKPIHHGWQIPGHIQALPDHLNQVNSDTYASKILDSFGLQICQKGSHSVELILTEMFPKNYRDTQAFEVICIKIDEPLAKFYNVTPHNTVQNIIPDFPYSLQMQDTNILLQAQCDSISNSYLWLKNTLLPQFIKWTEEPEGNGVGQGFCTESLYLVSKENYYVKYNELKLKYGKDMVKIWPECTDPSKFVYEDVAIATYLLLIWENRGSKAKKQSFIDLGCGNGLLVYILTREGHEGVGIDVRKRQIWDMYSSDIKLQEKTITPSDDCLFPYADWIIGNHSDELTPWIPVIAAKSSYKCNFFLLPCCSYNFDGSKYQRKNSFISQYMDYLEYIKLLCNEIGFNMDIDRLKIPSTKRICFVSRGRIYAENQHNDYLNNINGIIVRDSKSSIKTDTNGEWINDFKSRDPVEKIKNCTRIDKKLVKSIVDIISTYLLEGSNEDSANWNAGKTVDINELVPLISADQLKSLKSECGGLQTLMKNHHHIFLVHSGKVQLRYPKTLEEVNKDAKGSKKKTKIYKVRQKECWFYKNHPQGCPLADTTCSFLHNKS